MRTWADHIQKLRGMFPTIGDLQAQQLVSDAFLQLCQEEDWQFLITETVLTTEAPYSTGTVVSTPGSTAVVGTATVWVNTWTRKVIVLNGTPYRIASVTDNTNLVLEAEYGGPAALSAASYDIYQDEYALPADCDWGRDLYFLDPTDWNRLQLLDHAVFMESKIYAQGILGIPWAVTRVGWSTTGATAPAPLVQFGPDAPSSKREYPFIYLKRPARPTSLTAYPLWPEDFEDLIVLKAAVEFAESPSRPWNSRFELREKYNMRMWKARVRHGGGAQIDRFIRRRFPQYQTSNLYLNVRYSG